MTPQQTDIDVRLLAVEQLLKGSVTTCQANLVLAKFEAQGWTIHPVFFSGEVIGAIIQKGAEIHTSIAPKYQKVWNPRPYIRTILYPTLEKYGTINSEANKNDVRGVRWLVKLGFTQISEDETKLYFKLTEKKF